jgi:peptide deformylase
MVESSSIARLYPIRSAGTDQNVNDLRRPPVDAFGLTNYLKAMSIKPIIVLPDPKLRLVSKPVERFDAPLRNFAADMLDTMYDAPGIGLAAIQVGEPIRMLVLDLAKEGETKAPQVFINPEVVESSQERSVYEEGCLSIPDYYAEVERPAKVRVKYLDGHGKVQEVVAEGLLATCLQHEIDHLNGVLFIDHISKLKRDMVVKKFKKLARDRPPARMAG